MFLSDEQREELDAAPLQSLAELVVREEGFPTETEMSLLLVDEDEMSSYNRRFLNKTGPTDVLAFPVENLIPGVAPERDPYGPPLLIGDVIIAPGYVRRQAGRIGVTFEDEMALMVTHGILHLLGYDHIDDGDAERMENRERDLLAMAGRVRR